MDIKIINIFIISRKNISIELIVYCLFFASIMDKYLIRKSCTQDSSPIQNNINNFFFLLSIYKVLFLLNCLI